MTHQKGRNALRPYNITLIWCTLFRCNLLYITAIETRFKKVGFLNLFNSSRPQTTNYQPQPQKTSYSKQNIANQS